MLPSEQSEIRLRMPPRIRSDYAFPPAESRRIDGHGIITQDRSFGGSLVLRTNVETSMTRPKTS
jgi:hypothetical protein